MDSCVIFSVSCPEFYTNYRRISLQAPRSHQLPSATFCHTLSEGKYLNIQLLLKFCRQNLENIWPAYIQMCIIMFMGSVLIFPSFGVSLLFKYLSLLYLSIVCFLMVSHSVSLLLYMKMSLLICLSCHLMFLYLSLAQSV